VHQILHVIAPVDLSSCSRRALVHALAWARWHGAAVHVLHVVPPPQLIRAPDGTVVVAVEPRAIEEILRDVDIFVSGVDNPGVPIQLQVLQGDPAQTILDEARRRESTVVVMGSHGRTAVERIVVGSVAERVMHGSSTPTLIVPPHDRHDPRRAPIFTHIVCGIDLLPSSVQGLRYALSLAKNWNAEVEVVNVIEDGAADTLFDHQRYTVPEFQRYLAGEALRTMNGYVPPASLRKSSIHERVVVGEPVEALLAVAEEKGADLIVLGAGDRRHLPAIWRGTTTHRIVKGANCPVLIVPKVAVITEAAVEVPVMARAQHSSPRNISPTRNACPRPG
jgi:nucleotide-binding universal stress UspA family protein